MKKGGTAHRRSGLLFVCAMLLMGFSASLLGLRKGSGDPNVFTGLLTGYFVVTALTTVRPVSPWTRRLNIAAMTVAVGLSVGSISSGIKAFNDPGLSPGGVPFRTIGVMSFVIATVLMLGAIGDMRIMRFGARCGAGGVARGDRTRRIRDQGGSVGQRQDVF